MRDADIEPPSSADFTHETYWQPVTSGPLKFDKGRERAFCCVFVRAYRSGASGWLGLCLKPATHALRSAPGLQPMCLRHGNIAGKAQGFTAGRSARVHPKARIRR